ncbi:MAG: hypothetical protein QMD36_03920 [Candidatus Aenigmarchaeota archaeon]|nr:hypothetical protein [Candidatus Aenigmarchaeota archaeon]
MKGISSFLTKVAMILAIISVIPLVSSQSMNYTGANGTTFTQLEAINLSSFLVFVFFIPFTSATFISMKVRGISTIILPFLGLIVLIFLLSILLFPEIPRNISRTFSRLGITPPTEEEIPLVPEEIETFSVKEEQEETEIGKPVKWRKELVVKSLSLEEIKGYEVTGAPKDAKGLLRHLQSVDQQQYLLELLTS